MNNKVNDGSPKIFDSHAHLYSPSIVASVERRQGLAASLGLNTHGALDRTDKSALKRESAAAGVEGCLLLPIAPANIIHKTNELFLKAVEGEDSLCTAGTIHPLSPGIDDELSWLSGKGVRALKLCSFSQGFDLEAEATLRLFETIRSYNIAGRSRFFVILDTFYEADIYFGAPKEHLTTPSKFRKLAAEFPEIDFVAAHMGGLAAPFHEIDQHIVPIDNLYLDTSNASQALSKQEFLHLVYRHGPERILFGTDWPWFSHGEEVARIEDLLEDAGLSSEEKSKVFSGNIHRLLDL